MIIAKEKYKEGYIVYIDESEDAKYKSMIAHRGPYLRQQPPISIHANPTIDLLFRRGDEIMDRWVI